MKEINIVVGEKGSGKSTVLEIVNVLGVYCTELSVQWRYLEMLGFTRDEIPHKWDTGLISIVYNECLRNISQFPIFMGGFSRLSEIRFLQEKQFNIRVIGIVTQTAERHRRILKRNKMNEG